MSWQSLARSQHGVISRAQLLSAGLSRAAIESLHRRGDLIERIQRGVYVAAAVHDTTLTQAWAAVLATDAVLSHRSAGAVWRLGLGEIGRVEVTARTRRRTRMPHGVRVHRVAITDADVTEVGGLQITNRRRTIFDCLGILPAAGARNLLDRAFQSDWLAPGDVLERVKAEPGRRGNMQLRALAAQLGESHGERRLHRVLKSGGVRGWLPNAVIDIGWRTYRVDVAFEAEHLIIEFDGRAFHTSPEAFQADRTKQNALLGAGWQVLRFTWADVTDRPNYVLATVRQARQKQGMARSTG